MPIGKLPVQTKLSVEDLSRIRSLQRCCELGPYSALTIVEYMTTRRMKNRGKDTMARDEEQDSTREKRYRLFEKKSGILPCDLLRVLAKLCSASASTSDHDAHNHSLRIVEDDEAKIDFSELGRDHLPNLS
jgi:hypothetical protein